MDLVVTNRDGEEKQYTLKSTNYCSPTTEAKNNSPDSFWDTTRDKERLLPKSVARVAQADSDSDFEWGAVTYDDNEDDSDYCG